MPHWRIQDLTLGGVEVKVILKRVLSVFLLKLCLKFIASEASDEKNEKN